MGWWITVVRRMVKARRRQGVCVGGGLHLYLKDIIVF